MTVCLNVLTLALVALTLPVCAKDLSSPQRAVTETQVWLLSRAIYTAILCRSFEQGHRFAPEQMGNGYKRHREELRLQLLDRGYTILRGEEAGLMQDPPFRSLDECLSRSVQQADGATGNSADWSW